jgi:hypothetical protein
VALNDVVERGNEAAESGVNAKLVEQLRQAASMLEQFSWRQNFGGSPMGQHRFVLTKHNRPTIAHKCMNFA